MAHYSSDKMLPDQHTSPWQRAVRKCRSLSHIIHITHRGSTGAGGAETQPDTKRQGNSTASTDKLKSRRHWTMDGDHTNKEDDNHHNHQQHQQQQRPHFSLFDSQSHPELGVYRAENTCSYLPMTFSPTAAASSLNHLHHTTSSGSSYNSTTHPDNDPDFQHDEEVEIEKAHGLELCRGQIRLVLRHIRKTVLHQHVHDICLSRETRRQLRHIYVY